MDRTSTHTVQGGESLQAVAKRRLGDERRWPETHAPNKAQIEHPDRIDAGLTLELPPDATDQVAISGPAAAALDGGGAPPVEAQATIEAAAAAVPFAYRPQTLTSVEAARTPDGALSGVEANQQIVEAYSHFDAAFSDYLGNPPVANWTTFGKYAAREAGNAISQAERTHDALQELDLSAGASVTWDLLRNPTELGPFGMRLLGEAISGGVEDAWAEGGALSYIPTVLAASVAVESVRNLAKDATTLRNGLVGANIDIYTNFAPAFESFLSAESAGQDGVAAVRRETAAGRLDDPDGLLADALSCYQQARRLGQQAEAAPAQREALLAQREALVGRANMLIGIHEQYHIAGEAFADPEFARLVGAVSPEMGLTDANGRTQLLANQEGGNWADFATRMGFIELPAELGAAAFGGNAHLDSEVFRVRGTDGQHHYFAPNPEAAAREGTISSVFERGLRGERARLNIAHEPPQLGETAVTPRLEAAHPVAVREALAELDAGEPEAFGALAARVHESRPSMAKAIAALGRQEVSEDVREALKAVPGDVGQYEEAIEAASLPADFEAIKAMMAVWRSPDPQRNAELATALETTARGLEEQNA